MDKQFILSKVDELSADQLADFIKQGIVTLEELQETELLDRSKRNEIKKLLEADELEQQRAQAERKEADDAKWEEVRYTNNEIILIDWINDNPDNIHIPEAKERVRFLQEEREKIKFKKQEILNNILRNPNKYSAQDITNYLNNGTISEQELRDYCNVPQSAIDNLDKIKAPTFRYWLYS